MPWVLAPVFITETVASSISSFRLTTNRMVQEVHSDHVLGFPRSSRARVARYVLHQLLFTRRGHYEE